MPRKYKQLGFLTAMLMPDKRLPGYDTLSTDKQKAVFLVLIGPLDRGRSFPKTWLTAIQIAQS
jgi:hypothetical protein